MILRKKRFFTILTLLGLILIPLAIKKGRADFSVARIQSDLPFDPRWDVEIDEADLAERDRALSQTYRFLGKGAQTFAFVSEDGNYVVKFFKHYRWRVTPAERLLAFLPSYHKKSEQGIIRKIHQRDYTYQSARLAYLYLKEASGMVYVHLNPTKNLGKKLTIIDRLKTRHQLDLDSMIFVIQRKGIMAKDQLVAYRKAGKHQEAKTLITKLMQLIVETREMGYNDRDPYLLNNFGFLGNRPLQIDTGGYHIDPEKQLSYFYDEEMAFHQERTLKWVHRHYPEIAGDCSSFLHQIREKRLSAERIGEESW